MTSGYNWRATLTEFAAICGVLAGFSVTFIAFVLGEQVADIGVYGTTVTFGQISVLMFGLSTALFIASAELFLQAKESDVFSIPQPYRQLLKEDREQRRIEWAKFEDAQTIRCRQSERLGRYFYNSAIFMIFLGLFFVIAPYNQIIAFLVSGLGVSLEVWQFMR